MPDGPVVGLANFTQIVRGAFMACSLGYSIDEDRQGQGLMRETLEHAIAYVFDELGLHRVQASYLPTNERSGGLLRRLGFVVEGYARDYIYINGAWRDHVLTARTNPRGGTPRLQHHARRFRVGAMMRASLVALLLGMACASQPPPERDAAPSPLPAASTPEPTPPPSASASASHAGATPAPEPAKDDACPTDMVLVEGNYCRNLERDCLKKWEAPQNNLWVCEKFSSPTVCKDAPGESQPMRFCIDRYEFPNKAGVRPMVMQNFYQAQMHCAARGKRMCTETEWTKACEGPNNKPFPYGYTRDATICHGDMAWDRPDKKKFLRRDPVEIERLWQGKKSGASPQCVSDYGAYDMPGNADELAASETYNRGPRSSFDNVTTGGPWYKGVRNQCRPKIYSHDESFAYYYLSWRCCAEPDGKETDPRAPKQIKRGWTFEKVERIGKNSWNMPFNPKVPGEAGYSAAGPDRKPVAPKP